MSLRARPHELSALSWIALAVAGGTIAAMPALNGVDLGHLKRSNDQVVEKVNTVPQVGQQLGHVDETISQLSGRVDQLQNRPQPQPRIIVKPATPGPPGPAGPPGPKGTTIVQVTSAPRATRSAAPTPAATPAPAPTPTAACSYGEALRLLCPR